ncbi:MAG: thioredoxin fold domain-containing protein [Flavobacteriales bacterium]|jgi:thiol:disulfide interchange protein DsbD|nr:thioredoxin fold domain-containing protein [Flavobacteriales bacterium]MBT7481411.1 thioredoxin fold domain-containing protein [Flavobacteriales bacterium]
MNKFLAVLFTIFSFTINAQIFNPVSWDFSQKQISETEVELTFKASIDDHWHMYSQFIEDDIIATKFTFFYEGDTIVSKPSEGKSIEQYEPLWEMTLRYFEHEAIFKQRITVNSKSNIELGGYVDFMVCDESQCLPPDYSEFSFTIKGVEDVVEGKETLNFIQKKTEKTELEESNNKEKSEVKDIKVNDKKNSDESSSKGMWGLFFIAFFSGFAALLTPCVFPMIPMTVSFFTKQSKTKAKGITNAIIYGISIIVIYVALGVGVSAIFGADSMNLLATNIYFNIAFFVLLIVFGASFLGAFEITLPSSWVNKSDKASDKGGLIGIFFMAFTLALVSFSCTGPIVGTLLVEAASGGFMGPIIGMLGFSLAIALPFALFAAFPGWLNSLPQSGGWLNSVKVTLGFLEIALAFKFLSNADLVMDTHLLEREIFLAIWIVIFGLLTMYLLGFLKFAHDSELKYISVSRLSAAILTGTLTVYMIPGLWGAPLKLIAAFPPPLEYSESPYGLGNRLGGSADEHIEGQHLGPQGIMAFNDYDKGLAYAKKVGKPVVIDFTGKACVNCREMEQAVWSDPVIKNILKNDVVLISLYVDLKTKLPKEDQYETTLAGKTKKVRTIGDQWMVLQANTYGTNSQPYYVFLNHEEETLVENANYQDYGTVDLFKDWLNRGLAEFSK